MVRGASREDRGRVPGLRRPRRAGRHPRNDAASLPGHVVHSRGLRARVLHGRRGQGVVRPARARRRLCDGRFVSPLQHAGAGAVGVAAARTFPRDSRRLALRQDAAELRRRAPSAHAGAVVDRRRLPRRCWLDRLAGRQPARCGDISASGHGAARHPVAGAVGHEGRKHRSHRATRRCRSWTAKSGRATSRCPSGFVGVHGANYPVNLIHLWNGGPEEGWLALQLKPGSGIRVEPLKERLRAVFARELPDVRFSFEPSDIINRVMSFGSFTPIEVAVSGPDLAVSKAFADKIYARLAANPGAARRAFRPGARLSDGERERGPRARRPARREGWRCHPLTRRGHDVEPVHGRQLLGRSEFRRQLQPPGPDSAGRRPPRSKT